MLTRADVPIASPCGMDFRKMTRAEATKRFCGACKKHVHDLASMTEAEARALLAAPATAGLCVRYVADESGALMFLPDVPVGMLTARRRAAMAASLMAAAMSLTACMGARAPVESMGTPIDPHSVSAPRRFEITKGQTRLSIVDQPGALVDENAPPPPPGQAPPPHPFLSGSCGGGDPLGCSDARRLLEASRSTDEFIAKLVSEGFAVSPLP